MAKRTTAVHCHGCGWKGRRRPGDCDCYDEWAMYCGCVWGYCPKCKQKVSTQSLASLIRQGKANDKALAGQATP